MTSYLRNIFGYGRYDSKSSSKSSSSRPSLEEKGNLASRSHSRSRSAMPAPAPAYVYGQPAPPSVTIVQSQPPILTRPSSKRSRSQTRAATPSPLRYTTDDQAASYNQHHRSASHEPIPIYRTASYNKEAERGMSLLLSFVSFVVGCRSKQALPLFSFFTSIRGLMKNDHCLTHDPISMNSSSRPSPPPPSAQGIVLEQLEVQLANVHSPRLLLSFPALTPLPCWLWSSSTLLAPLRQRSAYAHVDLHHVS
jgi:hypothetical protein